MAHNGVGLMGERASEEIANVALMLTRRDSAGITGTVISVDGGAAPY